MSEGTRARGRLMPAPFAMPCRGSCVACCPAGVPGAVGPDSSGRAALCARGRRPAREPSAQRAPLGASSRSPARPRRRPRPPQPGPPVPPAPSTQWRLVADVWLGALTRCPARPRHSPRALEISRVKPASPLLTQGEPQMKPPSPLLAQGEPQMKPPSPLRVRNGRFGCVFRLQW